jgi:hypothetical protein
MIDKGCLAALSVSVRLVPTASHPPASRFPTLPATSVRLTTSGAEQTDMVSI